MLLPLLLLFSLQIWCANEMLFLTSRTLKNCTIHFGSKTFFIGQPRWLCIWYWSFNHRWGIFGRISIAWCKHFIYLNREASIVLYIFYLQGEITIPGSMRHLLYTRWAAVSKWYCYQPLDYVKEYFGVKIGLYFAWLGYYTYMLLLASIVGIACFIYSYMTMDSNVARYG